MDLCTHFWTLYFEGKIRDLKVKIELYTTVEVKSFIGKQLVSWYIFDTRTDLSAFEWNLADPRGT